MSIRIIPRLDIKGPNLVKGIHLEGLRVLGHPWEFARHYYENGADELIFVDVVASLYQRNSLKDIISKTAQEIFIPLTVAGGIRTIENIKDILRAGADKVAINTAAIQNPEFIRTASRLFGSSTIVVSIEAMLENGKYLVYTDNGREYTGVEALTWAKKAEELLLLVRNAASQAAKGVFPVPPTVRLPTLIAGSAGSTACSAPASYRRDRSDIAIAYAPDSGNSAARAIRCDARSPVQMSSTMPITCRTPRPASRR